MSAETRGGVEPDTDPDPGVLGGCAEALGTRGRVIEVRSESGEDARMRGHVNRWDLPGERIRGIAGGGCARGRPCDRGRAC